MTTMTESALNKQSVIETRREGTAYYKTLVKCSYAPINGLEMYYEIHGTVSARPLVTLTRFLDWRTSFPL